MDIENDYIKNVVVKCRARSTLYHTSSRKWGKVHWVFGITNGIVAATISLLSFIALRDDWESTEVGMIGGLMLTISSTVITSVKAGQKQVENEKAGDDYRNFEDKIRAGLGVANPDYDELVEKCQNKMTKLTNKYNEPSPKKCLQLEERFGAELFPVHTA